MVKLKERESRKIKMFSLPSRTKQSFKAECDINLIMKRFSKAAGGDFMARVNSYAGGSYGDFTDVVDYRSALDQLIAADATFEALPSIVRKRFDNDAASFLDFCNDPSNLDELRSMGLAKPALVVGSSLGTE